MSLPPTLYVAMPCGCVAYAYADMPAEITICAAHDTPPGLARFLTETLVEAWQETHVTPVERP